MLIPIVNLKPALEETEPLWRARLSELFTRMNFILGEQVAAFEREFAAATGAPHMIGVGNGTAAIEICLREVGLTDPRAEIITTPLTAAFTAIGIRSAGPRASFADIDPDTLLLDPADVDARWNRRTRAIVPVHLYGQPCPMDRFLALARTRDALLIQDAAQAHGARYNGKPLTRWSPYVTYSFYPTKNLGCLGDGGAIAATSRRTAARLRMFRDGGRRGGMISYLPGINTRLDEMQACYLRAVLTRLDDWNACRARIAAFYDEALASCPGVRLVRRNAPGVHHLYVIRARKREALRRFLAARGIGSAVHYPLPLHLHPAFSDCGLKRGDLPTAERACREVLSLPLWPHLPIERAEEVASAVRTFYETR